MYRRLHTKYSKDSATTPAQVELLMVATCNNLKSSKSIIKERYYEKVWIWCCQSTCFNHCGFCYPLFPGTTRFRDDRFPTSSVTSTPTQLIKSNPGKGWPQNQVYLTWENREYHTCWSIKWSLDTNIYVQYMYIYYILYHIYIYIYIFRVEVMRVLPTCNCGSVHKDLLGLKLSPTCPRQRSWQIMRNQEYTSIDQTCEHCPVMYRVCDEIHYCSFHGPVSIISLAQHKPTNHQNPLHDFTSEIHRVTPEVLQQTCVAGDTETVPATLYSHPGSEDLVVESRKCKCFRPHLAKLRRTGNDDGPCPCSHQGYECIILYIYIYMRIYLHVAGLS